MASSFVSFPGGDPRAKLDKLRAAVYTGCVEAVDQTASFVAAKARQNLKDAGRVDTGMLAGSIEYEVTGTSAAVTGKVVVGENYGRWVEFGRLGTVDSPTGTDPQTAARAAWPPVDVIREWVHRHFRQFAPLGRTKSGRARKGNPDRLAAAEDRLAYVVGRKIAQHGIPPTPFLLPAYDLGRKLFPKVLASSVAKRVKGV